MQNSTFFKIFMLGMMLVSFTVNGCESDAEEEVSDVGDTEDLREDMIEFSEDLYEIISNVESVEDVKGAEDDIAEIMGDFAKAMKLTMENPEMSTAMDSFSDDPELIGWSQKLNAASEKLKAEHPEVASEFEAMMEKHGKPIEEMMQAKQQKMMEEMMKQQQKGAPGGVSEGEDAPAGK